MQTSNLSAAPKKNFKNLIYQQKNRFSPMLGNGGTLAGDKG
jgi:hypothetical protein